MTIDTSTIQYTHYWAARESIVTALDDAETRIAAVEAGVTGLPARVTELEATLTQTITPAVAASSDDASETIATGVVAIDSLSGSFNDGSYHGVRFLVPELPQGASIVSATITFIANATTNGSGVVAIAGFDQDATATFTTGASDISARPITTATVSWEIAENTWPAESEQTTPDLSEIVQEIVDRAGFNGTLGFRFVKTSGSNRSVRTYDASVDEVAVLTVEYLGFPDAEAANITSALQEDGSFQQAGAAAVERSVWDKLREVVSVTDFGAVPSTPGGGIVDSTAAFQAAIDYVESAVLDNSSRKLGGIVFVPVGAWHITTIQMKTRVALVGASRGGTVIYHDDSGAHTGNMIELDDNLVNFTDLRNFTLHGAGDNNVSGVNYQNDSDVNADTIYDIGDPFHCIDNVDFFGFSGTNGVALTLNCRATLVSNVNIHKSTSGVLCQGSDNKFMNCDISWIEEDAFVITGGNNKLVNVKVWFCGANPVGGTTGDATYTEGDGFVIKSSRNTLVGCEAQDVSRHGLRIDNGDHNQIQGLILDNIGNFRVMQGHGVEHPTTTIKSAIKLESSNNGANYNRITATLAQRSVTPDLQAIVNIGDLCINNYIDVMRDPANKSTDAPDIVVDRGDATGNIVLINGVNQNLVVSSIADGLDDGQETISSTVVVATSNDTGIRSDRLQFLRFLVPDLPQGATITDARILFSCGSADDGAMDIEFWCEDADAAATLTEANTNISARATTTASVVWSSVPAWVSTADERRSYHQITPNLADAVQEVVDRAGFSGVLAFILQGSDPTEFRNFATFENSSATEATIWLTYTA